MNLIRHASFAILTATLIGGCAGGGKAGPGVAEMDAAEPEPETPDAAPRSPSTKDSGSTNQGGAGRTPDADEGGAGGSGDGGAAGAGGGADGGGGGGPASGPEIPGCTLVWAPSAVRDGAKAFEAAEMPDIQFPGGSPGTHQGVQHLTAVTDHDAYRIDSHYDPPNAVDYDRVTQTGPRRNDRLRCETRGMADGTGKTIEMLNGETWHFHWQFYAPASLTGTGRFTHIMQMKYVDKGGGASGSPIVTLTLRSGDRVELLLWLGGGSVATTSMAGLHGKWLTADLTMKIAPQGSVHWTFKDGDKVLVDKQQNGTIWPGDAARIRPKWGIYRGITAGVQSTYIQVSELRAYRCK